VPERCTCGAQLPPDALFCHKCGKPQRELLEPDPEPDPVTETPAIAAPLAAAPALGDSYKGAAPAPIGFHNGTAVRVALLAGVLSIVIWGIGGRIAPPVFFPVWMILSGMLTAFLYKLRTGQRLSTIAGARLGWISGIFGLVIIAILFGVFATAMVNDPATASSIRQQFAQSGQPGADFDTFVKELRSPSTWLLVLPLFFLLFTILSAFGGAIGARLLDRD
jgi:hypothetical protein